MSSSIFEQVTSAITVKSICSPMAPDILSGTAIDDFEGTSCIGINPDLNPARIINSKGITIGVVTFDDCCYDSGDEKSPFGGGRLVGLG